jgi:hypothetical protein
MDRTYAQEVIELRFLDHCEMCGGMERVKKKE